MLSPRSTEEKHELKSVSLVYSENGSEAMPNVSNTLSRLSKIFTGNSGINSERSRKESENYKIKLGH